MRACDEEETGRFTIDPQSPYFTDDDRSPHLVISRPFVSGAANEERHQKSFPQEERSSVGVRGGLSGGEKGAVETVKGRLIPTMPCLRL